MVKRLLFLLILIPALAHAQRYTVIKYLDTFYYKNLDAPFDSVKFTFPAWSKVQTKPTTLAGYGITDAQGALTSGTNIKTVNGSSILGSGDLTISTGVAWGAITGALSSQSDLQTALNAKQATITTGTTAQYFLGDLSLATFPTTTSGFSNSTNKNFVTDAQATVIGNTSGTNTGDQSTVSGNAGSATILQTARNIQGVSFNGSAAINIINGTGFVKSSGTTLSYDNSTYLTSITSGNVTTALGYTPLNPANNLSEVTPATARTNLGLVIGTNVLAPNGSAASLTSFPTLNQNTSGSAATLTTPRAIQGVNFDGSAAINPINGTGFVKASGTSLSYDNSTYQGVSAGALPATTGTMTATFTATQTVYTITPTGACTFNGSGGTAGARATFVITTSGVSSFVMTWSTNFKTTATLSTGTTSGKIFAVSFVCTNGTQWVETSRTAAQ